MGVRHCVIRCFLHKNQMTDDDAMTDNGNDAPYIATGLGTAFLMGGSDFR